MRYDNYIAENKEDLLNAIQTTAVADGWSLLYRGIDPGGGTITDIRTDTLWLTRNGMVGAFLHDGNVDTNFKQRLYPIGAMSYTPNISYSSQPGYSSCICTHANLPCRLVHVFSGSTYIYVVIETEAGHYRHCGLGLLDKAGGYVGGKFLYGEFSYPASYQHYVPFDYNAYASLESYATFSASCLFNGPAQGEFFLRNSTDSVYGGLMHGAGGITKYLTYSNSGNQFNRQAMLFPIYPILKRPDGYRAMAGTPPNIRSVNAGLITDEQEILLGTDTWICFPVGKRTTSEPAYACGTNAMAFLKSSG